MTESEFLAQMEREAKKPKPDIDTMRLPNEEEFGPMCPDVFIRVGPQGAYYAMLTEDGTVVPVEDWWGM